MNDKENRGLLRPAVLIFALVALAYSNALPNDFVYDDNPLIVDNPFIKSWKNIGTIFISGYWSHTGFAQGLYRPLPILSFLIEYSIVGLSPFLYHLDNLILHFLCSVFVYLILKTIFKNNWAALASALVFAVHPIHTETVSWISGRAELLSALFSLAALWLFIENKDDSRFVVVSSFMFLFGLMSKETAVVMPAMMAVYVLLFEDNVHAGNRASMFLKRLYPYFLVFAAYMALRLYVLHGAVSPHGLETFFIDKSGYYVFLSMCKAFIHYIRLALLPFNLAVDYLPPEQSSIFDFAVLLPIVLLALILLFAGRIIRFSRAAAFAIAWFLIALLPVSNIIPTGVYMSERAMYLPVILPCMITGIVASAGAKRVYAVLFAAVLILLMAGTVSRNSDWRNGYTLFHKLIETYPANARGYMGCGEYMYKQGRLKEAGDYAEESLRHRHYKTGAYSLLENVYSRLGVGMTEKSVGEFQELLKTIPSDQSRLRGIVYCNLGLAYGKTGRLNEAVLYLEKGVELYPEYGQGHRDLGVAYGIAGMPNKAIPEFKKALEINPEDALARENLYYALMVKRSAP